MKNQTDPSVTNPILKETQNNEAHKEAFRICRSRESKFFRVSSLAKVPYPFSLAIYPEVRAVYHENGCTTYYPSYQIASIRPSQHSDFIDDLQQAEEEARNMLIQQLEREINFYEREAQIKYEQQKLDLIKLKTEGIKAFEIPPP